MNVTRFFAFMKEAALLDHHLSVPRALEVFMQCNFAPEDADGWADWDWELEYMEFEEALTRLAIIKMKAEHSTLEQVPRLVVLVLSTKRHTPFSAGHLVFLRFHCFAGTGRTEPLRRTVRVACASAQFGEARQSLPAASSQHCAYCV
jgi:hypothetical protein